MKEEDKIMTILTLWCTFLMGYIDTYSFLNYNNLLVSAQTGNIVLLGSNISNGAYELMPHILSFVGFSAGAFVAQGLVESLNKEKRSTYTFFTFVQVVILFFVAFFETDIRIYGLAIVLGAFSGYNLTVFNRVSSTKINNGIMTGNIQKFMTNLYLTVFQKSKEAKKTAQIILVVVVTFTLGVFTATLFYHYLNLDMMLIVAMFSLIVHLWVIFVNRKNLYSKVDT